MNKIVFYLQDVTYSNKLVKIIFLKSTLVTIGQDHDKERPETMQNSKIVLYRFLFDATNLFRLDFYMTQQGFQHILWVTT